MANPHRPQAPGYLANLMARLFHEVSGAGLTPLGVRPEHFPVLIELWFGDGPVTRETLRASQEASAEAIDGLVQTLATDGLLAAFPATPSAPLTLTALGLSVRDPALAAARKANAAAAAVLTDEEMAQFLDLMNRVIDALQEAKS